MLNYPILIAHRGGVVDSARSENSSKALEEAIRRGYTHVEIDARATADGNVICFHNDDLREEAGVDGLISEMACDEVTRISLKRSGELIPTFDEYCAACSERIEVMVDLKGCSNALLVPYASEIEASLSRHGLLNKALILINKQPRDNQDVIAHRFSGKARTSWRWSLEEARARAAVDLSFVERHYVFNHAEDFSEADILGYHELGLTVVASINLHHYSESAVPTGTSHIRQLQAWGVNGFQIDSVYDDLFFAAS